MKIINPVLYRGKKKGKIAPGRKSIYGNGTVMNFHKVKKIYFSSVSWIKAGAARRRIHLVVGEDKDLMNRDPFSSSILRFVDLESRHGKAAAPCIDRCGRV